MAVVTVGPAGSDVRAEFEALARPLLPLLYGAAMRLARNDADASDLVQETFLRAFRTFRNFERGTNARAWLFTILHSVYVNAYHHARRENARYLIDASKLDSAIESASLDHYNERQGAADFSDCYGDLMAALNRLPDNFRLAVSLVDIEELTYEEAAAVLGCPVGTVRSRLFRGRKLLGDALRGSAQLASLFNRSAETD